MHAQDPAETRHAQHDLSLIAGLIGHGSSPDGHPADDLAAAEHARARAQLATCADCRSLHDDVLAIADATRSLPAPSAPRDFSITREQAARLRRTGWLATLLGPFAGARSAARPLAAACTTLGLAGIFVAGVLSGFGGATSAALRPAAEAAGGLYTTPTSTSGPVPAFGAAVASPGAGDDTGSKDALVATAQPTFANTTGDGRGATAGSVEDLGARPVNILLAGSLALLGLGLVLFGLRFAGRRLR